MMISTGTNCESYLGLMIVFTRNVALYSLLNNVSLSQIICEPEGANTQLGVGNCLNMGAGGDTLVGNMKCFTFLCPETHFKVV